jgi:uncharacterized protein YjbI with pentapeptide repeats
MANDDQIAQLMKGVDAWNAWREENPSNRPDFSQAILRRANLNRADLRLADLTEANLFKANLNQAILSEADLRGADLTGPPLKRAVSDCPPSRLWKRDRKSVVPSNCRCA